MIRQKKKEEEQLSLDEYLQQKKDALAASETLAARAAEAFDMKGLKPLAKEEVIILSRMHDSVVEYHNATMSFMHASNALARKTFFVIGVIVGQLPVVFQGVYGRNTNWDRLQRVLSNAQVCTLWKALMYRQLVLKLARSELCMESLFGSQVLWCTTGVHDLKFSIALQDDDLTFGDGGKGSKGGKNKRSGRSKEVVTDLNFTTPPIMRDSPRTRGPRGGGGRGGPRGGGQGGGAGANIVVDDSSFPSLA